MDNSVDFDDVMSYFHENKEINERFYNLAREAKTYDRSSVYYYDILELHLENFKKLDDLDSINVSICRCIEHKFYNQLELLLKNLDSMLSRATFKHGPKELDR